MARGTGWRIWVGHFFQKLPRCFARWHIKAGVHKYVPVYSNQFAMFQQNEGEAQGTARVLMTDHPSDRTLTAWQWDYPVGAGEYAALYPKSWYDYKWNQFSAHVVLEQLSPVLPDNYRETSYPVAIYRWYAENRTSKPVTVSVLLSWTNMAGQNGYEFCQKQMAECDRCLEEYLQRREDRSQGSTLPEEKRKGLLKKKGECSAV